MKPNVIKQSLLLLASIAIMAGSVHARADSTLERYLTEVSRSSKNAVFAEGTRYRDPIAIREDTALVPASTLKVLTAYLAIKRWGLRHRFTTEFYLADNTLWIKGLGDPYLTSEELDIITTQLRKRYPLAIKAIAADNTYFPDIQLDGQGDSDNPYDAINAALSLNFNSLKFKRNNGKVVSAEPQTPTTTTTRAVGSNYRLANGKSVRISLPGDRDSAARYFAEVLAQKLTNQSVPVKVASVPPGARLIYRHRNSHTLEEVLVGMLKYSNNFIANQLFLMMGHNGRTRQVSLERAQHYVQTQSEMTFGWPSLAIFEGAGLSRQNRLSAQQLIDILEVFRPWRHLLPAHNGKVRAKTGTLSGVRTYAGYYQDQDAQWRAFALLLNKPITYRFRYRFAESLAH